MITEEGLIAVKKLLRKTVTKSTAVSCHWIRGRRRSELLWIVGNRNKFNREGVDAWKEEAKVDQVRSVPTLILLENGVEVKRATGAKTLDQLKEFIKT